MKVCAPGTSKVRVTWLDQENLFSREMQEIIPRAEVREVHHQEVDENSDNDNYYCEKKEDSDVDVDQDYLSIREMQEIFPGAEIIDGDLHEDDGGDDEYYDINDRQEAGDHQHEGSDGEDAHCNDIVLSVQ